jgi:hypothetical protein
MKIPSVAICTQGIVLREKTFHRKILLDKLQSESLNAC